MLDYFDVAGRRVHDKAFRTRSLRGVQGLTGPTGARGVVFDRPDEDGAVEPDDQFMPARMVVLEGESWGATPDEAWADWDEVAEAFEQILRAPGECRWRRAGGTRDMQFTGRLAGEVVPRFQDGDNGPVVRWQAIIRAADPRHYSQTVLSQSVEPPTTGGGMELPIVFPIRFDSESSGGQMSCTNGGRTYTWPTITIDGPITNPVIENVTTGKRLAFSSLAVADGQRLVIETRPGAPRRVLLDGQNALGGLDFAVSEWWPLVKGENIIRFYGSAEIYGLNTLLTVSWRDAWIS